MARVLITGWSGTGKTTICLELQKRGLIAHDGDRVPGLAGWVDRRSGQWIGQNRPKDYSVDNFGWEWKADVFHATLQNHEALFLCGNATNAFDFYQHFDVVFFLDVAEHEQRRRIAVRTEHDYGKDPTVQDKIIERQRTLKPESVARGAVLVDANGEVAAVVDVILSHVAQIRRKA